MPIPKERDDEITEGMEGSKGGIEKLSWKSNLIKQGEEETDWFTGKERLGAERKDQSQRDLEEGDIWLQYGLGLADWEERQPDF